MTELQECVLLPLLLELLVVQTRSKCFVTFVSSLERVATLSHLFSSSLDSSGAKLTTVGPPEYVFLLPTRQTRHQPGCTSLSDWESSLVSSRFLSSFLFLSSSFSYLSRYFLLASLHADSPSLYLRPPQSSSEPLPVSTSSIVVRERSTRSSLSSTTPSRFVSFRFSLHPLLYHFIS